MNVLYIHTWHEVTYMYVHTCLYCTFIHIIHEASHTYIVCYVCAQYVCVHLYVVCDNSYRPNSNGMICIVLLSSCLWWRWKLILRIMDTTSLCSFAWSSGGFGSKRTSQRTFQLWRLMATPLYLTQRRRGHDRIAIAIAIAIATIKRQWDRTSDSRFTHFIEFIERRTWLDWRQHFVHHLLFHVGLNFLFYEWALPSSKLNMVFECIFQYWSGALRQCWYGRWNYFVPFKIPMLHPFPSGETKCSIGGGIVVEDERRQDCTVAWQDCTVAWQDCTVAWCICTDSGCGTRHAAVLHRHRSTVPAGQV